MPTPRSDEDTLTRIGRPSPTTVPGTPTDQLDKIERLATALNKAFFTIKELQDENIRLRSGGIAHAVVLESLNEVNPLAFQEGDTVLVIDDTNPYYGQTGLVAGKVGKDGNVDVQMESEKTLKYAVGLTGKAKKQLRLVGKNDGTNVIVAFDNKPYEVYGIPGRAVWPGDTVKVNVQSQAIMEPTGMELIGEIATVRRLLDNGKVEIAAGHSTKSVLLRKDLKLEVGDRVNLDPAGFMAVRQVPRDKDGEFSVHSNLNVKWDDIGGQPKAVEEVRQAVEWNVQHPEMYQFFGAKPPGGVLLWGGPGNGKTLLVKATFTAICELHGREKADKDGFILVSGPQLLSKWLGESEAGVREIFERNKRYYERTGLPGVIAIDEADAILPRRGSGICSDIRDTMVPQFLSKMDGVDPKMGIVFLLTNRPDALDEAAVREGRCDRHIKVERPSRQTAPEILGIHLRKLPLVGTDATEVVGKLVESVFDPGRVVYEVAVKGKKDKMTFGDVVSGATLAAIPERAKALAMARCIKGKTKPDGVRMEEFLEAVNLVYASREGQHDTYAQQEWLDERGVRQADAKFDNLVCGVA